MTAAPDRFAVAADTLISTFARIRRAGRRQAGRPEELGSLTGSQLELLKLVRRRPGVSVADAAAELRLAANTVSTLVRELTDARLLIRRVSASDRRVASLDVAPRINEQIDAWRDRRVLALARAIEDRPRAEREQLLAAVPALQAVAASLETGAPNYE